MKYVAQLALKRAIKDYIDGLKYDNTYTIAECENFFHSEQFDLISECAGFHDLSSDYIISMCKKAVVGNDR